MKREQMLSVLNAVDDQKLMQAMSAIGIDCGDGAGGLDYGAEDGADGLVGWNSTEVKVPESERPRLFDKSKTVERKQQPMPVRGMDSAAVLGPEQTGMEAWQAPSEY